MACALFSPHRHFSKVTFFFSFSWIVSLWTCLDWSELVSYEVCEGGSGYNTLQAPRFLVREGYFLQCTDSALHMGKVECPALRSQLKLFFIIEKYCSRLVVIQVKRGRNTELKRWWIYYRSAYKAPDFLYFNTFLWPLHQYQQELCCFLASPAPWATETCNWHQ